MTTGKTPQSIARNCGASKLYREARGGILSYREQPGLLIPTRVCELRSDRDRLFRRIAMSGVQNES